MARTVQAQASWNLPTGRNATPGSFIQPQISATNPEHNDTVTSVAQMLNNLYELWKTPIAEDRPVTPHTNTPGGAGVYNVFARYRIPTEHLGTGGFNEKLVVRCYAKMSGGDTGTIRVTTPDNQLASANFSNAAYAWIDVPVGGIVCNDGSITEAPEVYLEAKNAGAGTNVQVAAVDIQWQNTNATLTGALYANQFTPWDVVLNNGVGYPLSVEMMQRLIEDLRALKRSRTPGSIIRMWRQTAFAIPLKSLLPSGQGSQNPPQTDRTARVLTWQQEYVSEVEAWVYGIGTAASNWCAVRVGPYEGAIFGWHTSASTWRRVRLVMTPHTNEVPIPHEFSVYGDAFNFQGISAWWRNITGSIG